MPICTPYVDTNVGRVTVHSTAGRPTGADRYTGKVIFDTDVGMLFVWDGTAWRVQNVTSLATSGSRPTGGNLYAGRRIFETDTLRELVYDGTGWVIMSEPQNAWTPVWSNLTSTGPTNTGYYHRSDGFCDYRARYIVGTAVITVGSIGLTAPVAALSTAEFDAHTVHILDAGTAHFMGVTQGATASTMLIVTLGAAGATVNQAVTSATVPMTWATGDTIDVFGRFQMATRYT